jgi:hypothetical protein
MEIPCIFVERGSFHNSFLMVSVLLTRLLGERSLPAEIP